MDTNTTEGYTPQEKLQLIAAGNMDPKELGLVSQEEAQLQILKKEPAIPVLKDFITFEASEVPLALRAHWARKDLTVIPTNTTVWEADWCETTSDHRVQARIRCGTAMAILDQTFSESLPGMIKLMRDAAQILENQYAAQCAKVVDVETQIVTSSLNDETPDGNNAVGPG